MFPYKDLQTTYSRFIIVTPNWEIALVFFNSRIHKYIAEYLYSGIPINKYEECIVIISNNMSGSQKSQMKIILSEVNQTELYTT